MGEAWGAETEDVGPNGCLVLSPRPLGADAPLVLTLRDEDRGDALLVRGGVAWAQSSRFGIAYALDRGGTPSEQAAWFERRLRAWPRMASRIGRVPEQLPGSAPLYALPVQRILDVSDDEAALLRQLENGRTVAQILVRAGLPEERGARAMLALFDKGVVTLSMGLASDAWRWRAALRDSGRSPRVATARPEVAAPEPPRLSRIAPAARPLQPALPELSRMAPAAPPQQPAPSALPAPPTPALRASAAWKALDHHVADPALLRGVSPSRRCQQAQDRLDEARVAAKGGRIDQAVALLRRALALAPRDPEISRLLGELAFKDRQPLAAPHG